MVTIPDPPFRSPGKDAVCDWFGSGLTNDAAMAIAPAWMTTIRAMPPTAIEAGAKGGTRPYCSIDTGSQFFIRTSEGED